MRISKTLAGLAPALAALSIGASPVSAAPTVDGLFDQAGEGYTLLSSDPGRGDLYFARDGGTLYLLVQVDPSVNDNVFGQNGVDNAYLGSAGWSPPPHPFFQLELSDNLTMGLACGSETYSWEQDLLYPDGTVDENDPMATDWLSDAEGGEGDDTNAPVGLVSASSTQWNMNNSSWDITLGGSRTDFMDYKSPFDVATSVPDSYPGFDDDVDWEWTIIYEMSLDLGASCQDTASAAVTAAHNSPSKDDEENVIIPPEDIPDTAAITIIKATDPAGGEGFDFEGTGFSGDCGLDGFTLDDGEQESCTELDAGEYTIEETDLPAGWSLDTIDCTGNFDDGDVAEDVGEGTVEFNLEEGESATCTFTNTFTSTTEDSSISIVKQTIPDGADQSFSFTGTSDNGLPGACEGFSLEDGQSQICEGLTADSSYTFTETVPTDWSLDDVTCLVGGEEYDDYSVNENELTVNTPTENGVVDVVCTFTNDLQAGTIQVTKVAEPSDTGTAFDFTTGGGLTPGSFSLEHGETRVFSNVSVGSGYSVSETVPEDWHLESATCDDGTSTPENIDVQDGEVVTCTFTNKAKINAIPSISTIGMVMTGLLLALLGIFGLRSRAGGVSA